MIGVIGLGLIGGSLAKALNQNTDHVVYGVDLDPTVCQKAKLVNAIEEILTEDLLPQCDIVLIALYPHSTLEYLQTHQKSFKKGAIVLDCCGVKEQICSQGEALAQANGFTFMGGHPMAGAAHSGFDYAKKALFDHASMVLTPAKGTTIQDLETIKKLCTAIGFTHIQISSPREHDEMIAFTSQLAHVVSGAYIKSPTAEKHQGFSAGSYKDMTRVAALNESMWTELFLANRDNLSEEISTLIAHLEEYKTALDHQDEEALYRLLQEGRKRKEVIDHQQF